MIFLEMSRDETHGGGSWSFPNCIWAPTEKVGGGKWRFWSKILNVKSGDTILHLRGIPPDACFVGFSTASSDGFETHSRPPHPGKWGHSQKFYRADLCDFVPFFTPINLSKVFFARGPTLEQYFEKNKALGASKLNIFFVRQAGRLQCLNGAYLSEIDDELFAALFGMGSLALAIQEQALSISIQTSQQLAIVETRVGQTAFSRAIKNLYGNSCCFPSCSITDSRFLVASHIARWSDNEKLRGDFGNGLCLCLMHDKAFEIGLFTLDKQFNVFVAADLDSVHSTFIAQLKLAHGKQIRLSKIAPLQDALFEHWDRVDLTPQTLVADS
jgi:putative restriction endonuclease